MIPGRAPARPLKPQSSATFGSRRSTARGGTPAPVSGTSPPARKGRVAAGHQDLAPQRRTSSYAPEGARKQLVDVELVTALIGGAITLIGIAVAAYQAIRELKVRARIQVATKLVELRHKPYCELWDITSSGPTDSSGPTTEPTTLASEQERQRLADKLTAWYWPNGILLSGEAQAQWRSVRDTLRAEPGEPDKARLRELREELSLLRSWLKSDLFIRTASEVNRFSAGNVQKGASKQSSADRLRPG